ncbi:MAG: DoxX family protein [Pseudomonadaceae bacterium]|nr:DoxX family protein [Pseudomonadaceae bacterium]
MNPSIDASQRALFLLGRGLLGLYFVLPGITKILGWDDTVTYMAAHDVPMISVLLPLTIVIQIGGGLALMVGFRASAVAFVLAGLTLVINIYMHNFWGMDEGLARDHETQNFVKNLGIMAGLLVVAGLPAQAKPST